MSKGLRLKIGHALRDQLLIIQSGKRCVNPRKSKI